MKAKYIYITAVILLAIIGGIIYVILHISTEAPPSQAEREMAQMMGISVEEMRNQTPHEHMQMMMALDSARDDKSKMGMGSMMDGGMKNNDINGFLAGRGIDISTLPEAKASEILDVKNGEIIVLNPTLVRKTINGKEFAMYGYNGQIPGPVIKTTQQAEITVNVKNNIDMPTTIHWHGIRLDNANDGVPDVTQEIIQPDGTFTYTVKFPDEGIYWYHPHVREDIQQDLGLYGNLLVTPSNSDAYAPVNQEQFVVLDDILLSNNNIEPYGKNDATRPLMGRFGNIYLVNGVPIALGTDQDPPPSMQVKKGEVVRFYFTNVSNTRTFRITAPLNGSMKLVGSDVGRYEHESFTDELIIAPAERYIVDVLFDVSPRLVSFTHDPPAGDRLDVFSVEITDAVVQQSFKSEFSTLRSNEDVIADIHAFRQYFDMPVDKKLELSIEMNGMNHGGMMMGEGHADDGIEWEDSMAMMNEMMTGDQVEWKFIDTETGKENMDIHWQFTVGDVKKVQIINKEDSAHPMQHPIHFHGQRFLVLSMDGKKNDNLVWKDTVLIPAGSTAELLFDISNPGKWMFHCHIAEHLTNGMMGMFTVTK